MGCRVLVTGASGFVGSALVPYLVACGYQVRAISRAPLFPQAQLDVEWRQSPDLATDFDWTPLLADVDHVVHLAGLAHRRPGTDVSYDLVNRRATELLAQACYRHSMQRLIFLSSIGAQTGSAADHVVRESDVPRPMTDYDRAKLDAEVAVREAGVAHTILRPVVVYGPNPKANIAMLMRAAASPWPLPFRTFHNRRSLVAIDDLLRAIVFSLNSPSTCNNTFIVADRDPITLANMLVALRAGIGRSPNLISVPPAVVEVSLKALGREMLWDRIGRELVASSDRLQEAGWHPQVSAADGLRDLMRREYPDQTIR